MLGQEIPTLTTMTISSLTTMVQDTSPTQLEREPGTIVMEIHTPNDVRRISVFDFMNHFKVALPLGKAGDVI